MKKLLPLAFITLMLGLLGVKFAQAEVTEQAATDDISQRAVSLPIEQ